MDKKAAESRGYGQVRRVREKRDKTPDLSTELSFEELRNKFDTSAAVVRREIPSNPATHGSATRQSVSGKLFKKCKSATFQIDGATYTIGQCIPQKYLGIGQRLISTYYLHQFVIGQPDLNYCNPNVVEEMKDVLRLWLDKEVAGFRVDAIAHLFEVD